MNSSGHGKIILFGEHFVVHGMPAIVSALPQKTEANLQLLPQNVSNDRTIKIIDNRPKIPNFLSTKSIEYKNMVNAICDHLNIQNNLEITLGGDLLVTSGGIGASAAAATAVTKSLNIFFNLKLSDEQIYNTALEGEKAIHGSPSGIDNMAALRGDTFVFQKNIACSTTQPLVTPIKLKMPIHLVVADSGQPSNTKQAINDFRKNILGNPKILSKYENIYTRALTALENSDLEKLGTAMQSNHTLLQNLGVSHKKLDDMVKITLDAGALGSKLTGSGQGGLMIALTKNEAAQEKILNILKRLNLFAFKTTL